MSDLQLSVNDVANEVIKKIVRQEDHLSYSSISAFANSPRDFIKYKILKEEPTEAMIYGKLLHCVVLEPDKREERYVVLDDADIIKEIGGGNPRATNRYKDWKKAILESAGDRTLVSLQQWKDAELAADAISHDLSARLLLEITPDVEQEIVWEYNNYRWKGYVDRKGADAIADLKGTSDATPSAFKRTIWNDKLYLQGAIYLKGDALVNGLHSTYPFRKDFYNIAVDRSGGVSVLQHDPALILQGLKEYEYLIEKFSECVLTDGWNRSYGFFSPSRDGIFRIGARPY